MKLILTAMTLTIAGAIAAPGAAQDGPTSPPVPHEVQASPAAPAADPHAGHAQGQGQAPAGGMAHHAGMACCHHAEMHAEMFASIDADHDGSISRAEWDAHGSQMAPCQAPAATGADHNGHAGHGG